VFRLKKKEDAGRVSRGRARANVLASEFSSEALTTDDLAKAEGIGKTYVSQVLRLTLPAPEIVEAVLEGRQPSDLQLDDLLQGFPLEWERQHREMTA
jgi:hypothetical protein